MWTKKKILNYLLHRLVFPLLYLPRLSLLVSLGLGILFCKIGIEQLSDSPDNYFQMAIENYKVSFAFGSRSPPIQFSTKRGDYFLDAGLFPEQSLTVLYKVDGFKADLWIRKGTNSIAGIQVNDFVIPLSKTIDREHAEGRFCCALAIFIFLAGTIGYNYCVLVWGLDWKLTPQVLSVGEKIINDSTG